MKKRDYDKEPLSFKEGIAYLAKIYSINNPVSSAFLYLFGISYNKTFNKGKEKTAILVSANVLQRIGEYLTTIPALYFSETIRNKKVEIFDNANLSDFLKVLVEEKYKNIILDGHGFDGSWCAQDFEVRPEHIDFIKEHSSFRKKEGNIINLACGSKNGDITTKIAENSENTFYFPYNALGFDKMAFAADYFIESVNDKIRKYQERLSNKFK